MFRIVGVNFIVPHNKQVTHKNIIKQRFTKICKSYPNVINVVMSVHSKYLFSFFQDILLYDTIKVSGEKKFRFLN